jgi:hypothetical protein
MSWFWDLVKELPITGVQRERLQLAEDRIKQMEADNKRLKEEVTSLRIDNDSLRAQLSSLPTTQEYVEERGLLWKRRVGSGFHPQPYCPVCKLGMTKDNPPFIMNMATGESSTVRHKYQCPKCKLKSDVLVKEAPDIVAGLT